MGQIQKSPGSADWWARSISILSILLSIFSLWYVNMNRGIVSFAKPNTYGVEARKDGRLMIVFPVTAVNSGAVLHTLNTLSGRLVRCDNNHVAKCYMFVEMDSIPTPKATTPVLATGFTIPAKSSVTKIIGFVTDNEETLSKGEYNFVMDAYIDGTNKPLEQALKFKIHVNRQSLLFLKNIHWFANYKAYY